MSEYSEVVCFDPKSLWFLQRGTTTCDQRDDFSDRLLDENAARGVRGYEHPLGRCFDFYQQVHRAGRQRNITAVHDSLHGFVVLGFGMDSGYTLSYTAVLFTFFPWASVTVEVTVRVLPSEDK